MVEIAWNIISFYKTIGLYMYNLYKSPILLNAYYFPKGHTTIVLSKIITLNKYDAVLYNIMNLNHISKFI